MLPQSLLVAVSALAITTTTSANPLGKRCDASSTTSVVAAATSTATANDETTTPAAPTLPVTGGTSELPAANGTLIAVAVGHGIQNYTCTAANATATSLGALAVLYDITSIYASLSSDEQDQLPISLLRTTDLPLNLAGTDPDNQYAADVANPWIADADVTLDGVDEPLSVLGHHFFDASLTPTFDLYNADNLLFKGGKLSGVETIFVTASPKRHDLLKSLGATECFDYADPDVVSKIRAAADKGAEGPVIYAIDAIGAPGAAALCADATADNAKRASVREARDPRFTLPFSTKSREVTIALQGIGRITMPAQPEHQAQLWRGLLWAVENYGSRFSMPSVDVFEGKGEDAMEKVKLVAKGGNFGKIVLKHPLQ
ncbi:hypothetical protein G7054_g8590 [Neopestalotiopsis clavispora]|nr:hypothetical protein G7054_g8590 [Neopestalotiopsis clavispora]